MVVGGGSDCVSLSVISLSFIDRLTMKVETEGVKWDIQRSMYMCVYILDVLHTRKEFEMKLPTRIDVCGGVSFSLSLGEMKDLWKEISKSIQSLECMQPVFLLNSLSLSSSSILIAIRVSISFRISPA